MQSQAKSSGTPRGSWCEKKFGSQSETRKKHTLPKQGRLERPHIGQRRTGSKRKRPNPINQAINQPSNLLQEIPGRTKIEIKKTNHMHTTDPANSINNADDRM